jgi:uncharacterized phiE125 gp8 family phage protein
MALKIITHPATEPITLAEAKLQCKVDGTDDDTLITSLIQAAREEAEHEVGRPLITQTWELVLDAFPAAEISLGKPNVLAITSLKYYDEAEVEQTMASSDYTLDTEDTADCWVHPAIDTEWPATLDTANAVRVRFTCGYGSASDVPATIKAWMLVRIATLHKHREEFVSGVSVTKLPEAFTDRLLDRFRVYGL